MNSDLKLRLTPYKQLTKRQQRKLHALIKKLVHYSVPSGNTYALHLDPIENDEDDTAYTLSDGKHFDIYIDDRMPHGMITDYLIHELAHVRSWAHYEHDNHGPVFGVCYAELYRYYLELYEDLLC